MARMTFTGTEELTNKLLALATKGKDMSKMALYDGAGLVADALRGATNALPLATTRPFDGVSADDREDLAGGIGIAKFEEPDNGSVTTAIAFNGYTRRTEPKYPSGVPLAMIARSLESGSSLRQKHPFVRIAVNAAKAAALAAMSKRFDEEIKKVME